MRILLVEDDPRVASFIRRGLREEQFTVDVAKDAEQAQDIAQSNDFDLVILDWLLPKGSGIEVLRSLRAERNAVPVLMLTAKDELLDKVQGFEAGADDYLTKPFGFAELLARVRALLRRRGDLIETALRAGDLEMDTLRHRIMRNGQEIALTLREHGLLEYLLRHKDEVVTRTQLAEHVWEHDFDPLSNVIDVQVARLRRKVDDGHRLRLIHTVRGRGYIISEKAPPA